MTIKLKNRCLLLASLATVLMPNSSYGMDAILHKTCEKVNAIIGRRPAAEVCELLSRFALPGIGIADTREVDNDSEQIVHMIYYANLANTPEVQNWVHGLPGHFSPELLPPEVIRYARASS